MRFIILVASIFSVLDSVSQIKCGSVIEDSMVAFHRGEELHYDIKYSSAMVTTSIADVKFQTEIDNGAYKISALGKTRPFYSIFFEIEDLYNTWLDRNTLRPLRTTSNIREGGYRYRTDFRYNWSDMTVHTMGQNIKRGATYNKTMPLIACSFDALALFYNLRCVNINEIEIGRRYRLDLVLEDTIRTVEYRLVGRETMKVNRVGEFKTLKVACTIATESGDALKDGSEFYIWLSDDRNRIPIYMESPIRVGSIKVYINNWVNLKHPFDYKDLSRRR